MKASAEKREVSLSEEIERRLEASFQSAADPYMDTALRMAAANCDVVQGMLGGRNIAEDAFVRGACAKAAASAIELVGGLAERDAPGTTELLQADAEAFGAVVAMFTEAMRNGVKNDFTEGVGAIAELAAMRRNYTVELQEALQQASDQKARTAELARLLRDSAPAELAPEPAFLPTTPDELARMEPARGQLPPSIGDQAIFDDAVSGLPLVQAEKAAAAKRREQAPLDVGAGSPDAMVPPVAPKRRGRAKAEV